MCLVIQRHDNRTCNVFANAKIILSTLSATLASDVIAAFDNSCYERRQNACECHWKRLTSSQPRLKQLR